MSDRIGMAWRPPLSSEILQAIREQVEAGGPARTVKIDTEAGSGLIWVFDGRPYGFSVRQSRAMKTLGAVGPHLADRGWSVDKWHHSELALIADSVRVLKIVEMPADDFLVYAIHFGLEMQLRMPAGDIQEWCAAVIEEDRARKSEAATTRENARRERLARNKPAETESMPTLCVRCQKRPQHFDDLCKRCANDLGVRPTGPVR